MQDFLGPDDWTAVLLSLRIAIVALLGSLPFGILVAYGLARWHFPGKTLVTALIYLPLVVPPVVTGYLLLIGFGRRGIFGQALADLGIVLSFRWTGAALACAIMGFPLMVRAIRLSFKSIDPESGEGGEYVGRQSGVSLFARQPAFSSSGNYRGRDFVVRPCARRIRRDDHLRLEHSRRDADDPHTHLHLYAGAGR